MPRVTAAGPSWALAAALREPLSYLHDEAGDRCWQNLATCSPSSRPEGGPGTPSAPLQSPPRLRGCFPSPQPKPVLRVELWLCDIRGGAPGRRGLSLSLPPLGKWAGRFLKRHRAAFSEAQVTRKCDVLRGAVWRLSHWTGSPRCCQGGHRTWSRGPRHRNHGESCCSPFDSRAALSEGGRHPGHWGARPGGRGTSCPASRGPQPGAHPSQRVWTVAAGAAEPRRQKCLASGGGGVVLTFHSRAAAGPAWMQGRRPSGRTVRAHSRPAAWTPAEGHSGAWPATTMALGAQAMQSHLSLAVGWLRPCRQDASPRAGPPCTLTRSEGLTSPSLSLKDMKPDLKSTSGVGTTALAH